MSMSNCKDFLYYEAGGLNEEITSQDMSFTARIFNPIDLEKELVLDRSKLRMMNRSTMLLTYALNKNEISKKIKAYNRDMIAIYSPNYTSRFPREVFATSTGGFDGFKKLTPHSIFHRSNALTLSQISTLIEVTGPSYTFMHKKWAVVQALEQAKFDIESKKIELAIMIMVRSFKEDYSNYLPHGFNSKDFLEEEILICCLSQVSNELINDVLKELKKDKIYVPLKNIKELIQVEVKKNERQELE